MTRSRTLRRGLKTAAVVLLAAVAWLSLAPTGIGGPMSYVTTSGDSMAPRFQTGDLALIRRADRYRVGDIVAYRSALLGTVVLHRIVARDRGRYVFKGDNNDFVDPSHPARRELIGKLWLRVPHAGLVLDRLHTPVATAVLTAAAAALLLLLHGGRRRNRPRGGPARSRQGARPVPSPRPQIDAQRILAASSVAFVAFLALAVVAFTRPATSAATVEAPYSEHISVGYHARAARGPVYQGGLLKTGDPIFLRLVRRVRVTVAYRVTAGAPHRLTGTIAIAVRLTSPTGWTHNMTLSSPTPFAGDRASSAVTLDLPRLRSLADRLETLTGAPVGGAYTLAVVPRVDLTGTLAGKPLTSQFDPALSFQVDALQMKPASSTSAGPTAGALEQRQKGTVAAAASAPNRLSVRGHGLPVTAARWIALAGLALAAMSALLSRLPRLRPLSDPAARTQARYARLIVPISALTPNPARATVDVTSIAALAQLADRCERPILHYHHLNTDTYLVDDDGTLYRHRTTSAAAQSEPAPLCVAGSAAVSAQYE